MGEHSQEAAADIPYGDVGDKLDEHEERLTSLEIWRHRAEGALALIGFTLGGGALVTLLLLILGII